MALSKLQIREVEAALKVFMSKRRPSASIRHELDLGYRIEGQNVFLFEIRPKWNFPQEKLEMPFAKATFVRTKNHWKIFWMRADRKWHSYPPVPTVKKLDRFLELVDEDSHGCFWG